MKGQLIGQVFIYIIAIVIVAFILVYGYNAITTFKGKADQVSYIQFKNKLQNTIEVLTVDFGSVRIEEFTVPDNINTICFVKNYEGFPTLTNTGYPLMEDSVNSKIDKNVFLIENNIEESFLAGTIALASGDYSCIPVRGSKIELRMEGMGDHTIIS